MIWAPTGKLEAIVKAAAAASVSVKRLGEITSRPPGKSVEKTSTADAVEYG